MKLFYGRVSTEKQKLDKQIDLAKKLKIENKYIFMEKESGTIKNRPMLERLKDEIRDDDELHIESLSRLSRSLRDLLELIEYFESRNIKLISHSENIDTTTINGKMFIQLIGVLNEFSRNIIVENTKKGLESARARGRVGGRKKVDRNIIKTAIAMYDSKDFSIDYICKANGISRKTLYNYLNERKIENNDIEL